MNILRRDFLTLVPAAAALVTAPALATSLHADGRSDARLHEAHARWKAARAAWAVATKPADDLEGAIFDESRVLFGDPEGRDADCFNLSNAWCRGQKTERGFHRLEEEADRLLGLEDEALLAFYATPALTLAGALLKANVAGEIGDSDMVWNHLVADLERLAGGAA